MPTIDDRNLPKGLVSKTDIQIPRQIAPLLGHWMAIKIVIVRVPPCELIETTRHQHHGHGSEEIICDHLRTQHLLVEDVFATAQGLDKANEICIGRFGFRRFG